MSVAIGPGNPLFDSVETYVAENDPDSYELIHDPPTYVGDSGDSYAITYHNKIETKTVWDVDSDGALTYPRYAEIPDQFFQVC